MSAAPREVALIGGPRDGETITVHDGIRTISVAEGDDEVGYGAGDYVCRTEAGDVAEWTGYWQRWK